MTSAQIIFPLYFLPSGSGVMVMGTGRLIHAALWFISTLCRSVPCCARPAKRTSGW